MTVPPIPARPWLSPSASSTAGRSSPKRGAAKTVADHGRRHDDGDGDAGQPSGFRLGRAWRDEIGHGRVGPLGSASGPTSRPVAPIATQRRRPRAGLLAACVDVARPARHALDWDEAAVRDLETGGGLQPLRLLHARPTQRARSRPRRAAERPLPADARRGGPDRQRGGRMGLRGDGAPRTPPPDRGFRDLQRPQRHGHVAGPAQQTDEDHLVRLGVHHPQPAAGRRADRHLGPHAEGSFQLRDGAWLPVPLGRELQDQARAHRGRARGTNATTPTNSTASTSRSGSTSC